MILMLIRTALWGIAIILAALAFVWLKDAGGLIDVELNGRKYGPFRPMEFVLLILALGLLIWLAIKAFSFTIALVRFFSGDETALSRFWSRSRERRGFDALAGGLTSLAEGNGREAMTKARKAERLLDRPGLTRLLIAQAAEVSGDKTVAQDYYKQLASDPATAYVGIRGLLLQAQKNGDKRKALKLAAHAVELKPRDKDAITALFELQCEAGAWEDARRTLHNAVRANAITSDVATRREAVLLIADAQSAESRGDGTSARELAGRAHRKSPALVPASVAVSSHLTADGNNRKAAKILRDAWKAAPHPDIAAAFAALEPDETSAERRKRFKELSKANPDHPETKLMNAELALADEDWPAARREVADLADKDPTARALAIMAAAEKGDGSDDSVVRGWLARAVAAPRGSHWTCTNCGAAHGSWAPICERCEAFDTLDWRDAEVSEDAAAVAAAMLPIMTDGPEVVASTDEAPAAGVAKTHEAPNGATPPKDKTATPPT
ncbi:MAG: heme biosynthesis HemY N-terminal domain-containing protein [Pseudomonadota bacterium]